MKRRKANKILLASLFSPPFFCNAQENQTAVKKDKLAEITPDSWSFVLLPDTQYYSEKFPKLFTAQTQWIAENAEKHHIKHVLHLGDLVNRHKVENQWKNARVSMQVLEKAKMPYSFCLGNHDVDTKSRDSSLANKYFKYDNVSKCKTFGGAMKEGDVSNTYSVFEAGGKKWIIIALEWAPRDEAVAWANKIMGQHKGHHGILLVHAYMYNNDHRYDISDKKHPQKWNPHLYKSPGTTNDGQQLWDKLVKNHSFVFTFNGHVLGDGAGYLKSVTEKGNTCHQILTNYQMRKSGGEGFLKIVEFDPDGKTVRFKAYSPHTKKYLSERDQSFVVEIPATV